MRHQGEATHETERPRHGNNAITDAAVIWLKAPDEHHGTDTKARRLMVNVHAGYFSLKDH
jgi:hypothetical protein